MFLHLHVQCVKQLRGHQNTVSSVLARNNSQQIVSGSHDGTLRVWDVGEGELFMSVYLVLFRGISENIRNLSWIHSYSNLTSRSSTKFQFSL